MSQSSFIAAVLLAGFVLYLAATNRLGTYAKVLWGATTSKSSTPTATPGNQPTSVAGKDLSIPSTGNPFMDFIHKLAVERVN